ncbi:MAG: epoxyqueuosine reductase QueH [Bacilli bacterium]|nr:epoxyqueuosine reductase QueH [Bacilli bacterium]
MKILLHVCCAPCSIMSIKKLRELNHDVTGFWYNPNIHPYMEYRSRRDAFRNYSKLIDLPSIYKDEYGLDEFCREVINNLDNRCKSCYAKRICVVAKYAKEHGYDAFCTSLLYSPYQDHEALKEVCYEIAKAFDIEFYYYDFRPYYREGQEEAKRLGIYMQKYCGCIFSEEDRYKKRIERERIKEEIDIEWEKYKKENQIEDLKKEF